MDYKKIFTLLLSIWSMIAFAQPQEVISFSGGVFENEYGSISFTMGECITSTYTAGNYILTQGFHQTKLTIVDIPLNKVSEYEISAFPNPVEENMTLKVDIPTGFNYVLYDMKGVLIERNQIISTETEIDFHNHAPSTYILRVYKSTEEVRTFKIIKQ